MRRAAAARLLAQAFSGGEPAACGLNATQPVSLVGLAEQLAAARHGASVARAHGGRGVGHVIGQGGVCLHAPPQHLRGMHAGPPAGWPLFPMLPVAALPRFALASRPFGSVMARHPLQRGPGLRPGSTTISTAAVHATLRRALDRGNQAAVDAWRAYAQPVLQHGARSWSEGMQLLQAYYTWPTWATTTLTMRLPGISRSLQIPWTRLPSREWFLRPSLDARVAILNALYAVGGNLHRTLPLLAAQVVRRDSYLARCFTESGPPQDTMQVLYRRTLPAPRTWLQEVAFAFSSLLRLLQLSAVFGPLLAAAPLCLLYDVARPQWLSALRRALQSSGPAFIKWGQWAATRADLFPRDLCAELAKLQTQAPSHAFSHTAAQFEASFGMPIELLFDSFEVQPIASGSIGQIYRGCLSETGARYTGTTPGRCVAVKVRHPGVTRAIERDFSLMLWAAHMANQVPGLAHLRLEDSLRQFAAPLREQVDFSLEALHLWQFNYNFRKSKHVHFPLPLFPLVSESVLVETFEEGEQVSRYVEAGQSGRYSSALAQLGCNAMLQMMLVDNLIHADLHPGNILVRLQPPDNPVARGVFEAAKRLRGGQAPPGWLHPHFVLLDVGMTNALGPRDQTHMVGLFKGLTQLDGREIGTHTLAFAGKQQSCPDPEAFLRDLDGYFRELRAAESWEETQYRNGAEAMSAALEFVRRHKVSLPGHVCAVLVTSLVLEGWSSKLDPEHSVLEQVDRLLSAHEARWDVRVRRWWAGERQVEQQEEELDTTPLKVIAE